MTKKIISLILMFIILLCLVSCGTNPLSKSTVNQLSQTFDTLNAEMIYLMDAWSFTLSASTAKTGPEYEKLWTNYQSTMQLTEDEVVEGLINACGATLQDLSKYGSDHKTKDVNAGLNTVIDGMLLANPSHAINVAKYNWEKKNRESKNQANKNLTEINSLLQNTKQKSEYYALLQEYDSILTEINSWIESPTGSYNDATNLIQSYSEKVLELDTELESIAEE